MKDETWFMEQLEKAIVKCGSVSMLASEKGVDVLRYIYDQGRADQNEADDIGVLNELKYAKEHNENDLIHGLTLARYAIRAAGPEDK